jgi:hypothetical protein
MTRIITTVLVAIAAALMWPAPASASPRSYLATLEALGHPVYDAGAAVANGYAVCNLLDAGYTDTDVAFMVLAQFPSEATINMAAALVVVAESELCPGGFVA